VAGHLQGPLGPAGVQGGGTAGFEAAQGPLDGWDVVHPGAGDQALDFVVEGHHADPVSRLELGHQVAGGLPGQFERAPGHRTGAVQGQGQVQGRPVFLGVGVGGGWHDADDQVKFAGFAQRDGAAQGKELDLRLVHVDLQRVARRAFLAWTGALSLAVAGAAAEVSVSYTR